MADLQLLLNASAALHKDHLCPRQVLGVRMGLYAGILLGINLPQTDKRLVSLVETDGCMADGVMVATGSSFGHRTMRLMDYGKTAATFVDLYSERAIRISPAFEARARSRFYAPSAPSRWHAQLAAYQIMPDEELLDAQVVVLTISLKAIISSHGGRVVCDQCGEDIINERYVKQDEKYLCLACAHGAYYSISCDPFHMKASEELRKIDKFHC